MGAAGVGVRWCVPQDSPAWCQGNDTSQKSLGIINVAIGAEHISAAGGAGEVRTQ